MDFPNEVASTLREVDIHRLTLHWAAILKSCKLGSLNRHFLTVLEAESLRSECQRGRVLVRALPRLGGLLAGQPAEGEQALVPLPLLVSTLILLDQGPTLVTSFNFSYCHGGSVSTHCHITAQGFQVWTSAGQKHWFHNTHKHLDILFLTQWMVPVIIDTFLLNDLILISFIGMLVET